MHPLIVYERGEPLLRIEFEPENCHLIPGALRAISEILIAEPDPKGTKTDQIYAYFCVYPGRTVYQSIQQKGDFDTEEPHNKISAEEGVILLQPEKVTFEDCTD